jgi:tRNA(Ile)-lysidine synthase
MSQDDYKLIEELIDNQWGSVVSGTIYPSLNPHLSISLKIKEILSLNPSIQKQVLRRAYFNLVGGLENLTYRHVEQIIDVLKGESGKSCFLPNAIQIINEYKILTFYKNQAGLCGCEKIHSIPVKVPGETKLSNEWSIMTNYFSGSLSANPKQENISAIFRGTLGETELNIRTRIPGDRFQPLGMTQSKNLSRYFIDQKIPRNRRCCLPLLISNDSIAWVGGLQIAEWSKVSKKAEPILLVQLKNNNLQNQTEF